MQTQFGILAAEVLKLAPDEREAFVLLLAASLDQDAGGEEALAIEVERRVAGVESGAMQTIPLDEALVLVRAGLA